MLDPQTISNAKSFIKRFHNVALFLFLLTGCSLSSGGNSGILNSLRNRGAVPLSTQNPYIAGNLLLSTEMDKSPELRGFIQSRGAPRAIEVAKKFASPTLLRLYYTETQEYYVAEQSGKDWLIHGPKKIPDSGMKLLFSIIELTKNAPLLKIPNEVTAPPNSIEKNAPAITEEPDIRQPDIAMDIKDRTTSDNTTWQPATIKEPPHLNSLPQSETVSQDPLIPVVLRLKDTVTENAEISPKGDLVHYVTYPGESLTMISRWYTLEARNVGRIARINNIQNPSNLEIGDSIVIPGYLVKNKARLNESSLRTLFAELAKK